MALLLSIQGALIMRMSTDASSGTEPVHPGAKAAQTCVPVHIVAGDASLCQGWTTPDAGPRLFIVAVVDPGSGGTAFAVDRIESGFAGSAGIIELGHHAVGFQRAMRVIAGVGKKYRYRSSAVVAPRVFDGNAGVAFPVLALIARRQTCGARPQQENGRYFAIFRKKQLRAPV
jgi:hypothetical protein